MAVARSPRCDPCTRPSKLSLVSNQVQFRDRHSRLVTLPAQGEIVSGDDLPAARHPRPVDQRSVVLAVARLHVGLSGRGRP